jgi:hypothetical protein
MRRRARRAGRRTRGREDFSTAGCGHFAIVVPAKTRGRGASGVSPLRTV